MTPAQEARRRNIVSRLECKGDEYRSHTMTASHCWNSVGDYLGHYDQSGAFQFSTNDNEISHMNLSEQEMKGARHETGD